MRKRVVDYIQRLIRTCLGAEVFAYGSVPLKTYLPDGDIDLTTFGGANVEDTFAEDMRAILQEEEKNTSSEFVVKDVQLVRAEVKLVKCIVQDIVVDVSFNQIGGLCTLCFLEQVDRLIGKDHLFKRSIILIKSWCYYESRILGAHHGLISTYALETMVLYIFHLFHSKLDGPLSVLFKFLDYFSKFDWDTYCLSLNGPVRLSSLPAIVVEMPEDSDQELLLHNDFLTLCVETFSVPYRGGENNSRGFQLKHLNIVDPLKEMNNLGRSVSRGNFYRIRSAFSYGARKLARIICQPVNSITNELHLFFSNTLGRHGGSYRPEIDFLDISTRNFRQDIPKQTEQTSNTNMSENSFGFPYHAPHLYFPKKDQDPDEPYKHEKQNISPSKPDENRARESNEDSSCDLSGDFEGYMRCLNYGKWWYEQGLNVVHSLSLPPLSGPPFPSNGPLSHFRPNGFSYGHHPNGLHLGPGPAMYNVQPVILPNVTFGWEEVPKPRGTGTYFPNTNQLPQVYRPPTAMIGRNQNQLAQGYNKPVGNNEQNNMIFTEANMLERSSHEVSHSQYSSRHNSNNSLLIQSEGGGLAGLDKVKHAPENSLIHMSQSSLSKEQNRILLGSSYLLKDDEDFPPLPA
ncbi:PAP/OAS1 substrate-binding domain superfamily [Striga hermonthica]|uniref:PAP/OAS1 substrate-binding domain superfamily n=1 Tax=Striga hermonthica TaxID=68872 RepID=A0A9N7NRB4_STRHE|nr:PAP/OAS1 substrate-binding domain superfamily [Striga hermonthica]